VIPLRSEAKLREAGRIQNPPESDLEDRVATLARWCFRHRRIVLPVWILALIIISGISHSAGSSYSNNFSFPATDSSRAENVVKANFPAQSGDSDQIVVQARHGTLIDPATESAVQAMLIKVKNLPFVTNVTSPYGPGGLISTDGTIGLATVQLDAQVQNVSTSQAKQLIHTAQAARSNTLNVQLGGAAIQRGENQGGGSADFIGGVVLALIVLFVAFRRSILSAVLPLMSAVGAIGVGVSLIGLLSHVITMPEFSTQLAELISLGVGIDYALFIVNRHRRELLAGHSPEEAAIRALNTSGRAVLVAGLTVCIALLSMFAMGLSFLYGVALGSALVVALTMLASITLIPAMLGFYGYKALARRERPAALALGPNSREDAMVTGFWVRWSNMVGSRSAVLSVVALGLIVVIALPFFSLRLGIADSGEDPSSSTTRQAYDLLAQGFGPGFNGPLQVVGAVNAPGDIPRYDSFVSSLSGQPGVAKVLPTRTSPNGRALVTFIYPEYSPQAAQTNTLVNHIRSEAKSATSGSSLAIHVGGQTAGGIDFSKVLSGKMPLFVAVIVVLAFLLLTAVFRSLLVPLTASVMNLLSIGAALGTMVAAFQWGWAKHLLGFAHAGPIEVYLPVMVFAVLFGLSMDYEVFLVSRMHEEWVVSSDNDQAVSRGQSETGRVITAAALIMILVFLSFSLLGNALVIQEFGIGFAAAIVIDAFVVRTVLVPALMHVFGKANWWLPGWLDRFLPTLHIEAEDLGQPHPVLEEVRT
jgi:RND superfamily putative drug exporter